jgi:hypothetical protein
MRKLKAVKAKKPTVKSVTTAFYGYRAIAKEYIRTLQKPLQRKLMSSEAADETGRLNGLTIVELITISRMAENTGERVFLAVTDNNKNITLYAEKWPASAPFILL